MPPKVKFTKEQIIKAAIDLVREQGVEALTARNISSALGSSPQPLFSCFENMEELRAEVLKNAEGIYSSYIHQGLKEKLPFKGAGMAYMRFANDEPRLFKMLFMTPNNKNVVKHFLPKNDVNYDNILSSLEKTWDVDREKAERVYNHISVYTHGMAILFCQGAGVFTIDEAGDMMSEVFRSLMEGEKFRL